MGTRSAQRLERDVAEHLKKSVDLQARNVELMEKLIEAELLSAQESAEFDADKYNAIVHRFRKYWLNYFL